MVRKSFSLMMLALALCGSCYAAAGDGKPDNGDKMLYEANFENAGGWTKFQGGEVNATKLENEPSPGKASNVLQVKGDDKSIGLIYNKLGVTVTGSTVVEFDWKSDCDSPLDYVAVSLTAEGRPLTEPFWLFANKCNTIINPELNRWHHAKLSALVFKSIDGKQNIKPGDKIVGFGLFQGQSSGKPQRLSIANFRLYESNSRKQLSNPDAWSQNTAVEAKPDTAFPLVTLPYCANPLPLDGKLNPGRWSRAVKIQTLPNRTGEKLTDGTSFYLAYDKENLYIAAEAQQPYLDPVFNQLDKVKPLATKRDDPVYYDDSIEFFLIPNGNCYQFVVNMDGTVYDSKNKDSQWTSTLQVATSKQDRSWTVELALPLSDLGVAGWLGRENVARQFLPEQSFEEGGWGVESNREAVQHRGVFRIFVLRPFRPNRPMRGGAAEARRSHIRSVRRDKGAPDCAWSGESGAHSCG